MAQRLVANIDDAGHKFSKKEKGSEFNSGPFSKILQIKLAGLHQAVGFLLAGRGDQTIGE